MLQRFFHVGFTLWIHPCLFCWDLIPRCCCCCCSWNPPGRQRAPLRVDWLWLEQDVRFLHELIRFEQLDHNKRSSGHEAASMLLFSGKWGLLCYRSLKFWLRRRQRRKSGLFFLFSLTMTSWSCYYSPVFVFFYSVTSWWRWWRCQTAASRKHCGVTKRPSSVWPLTLKMNTWWEKNRTIFFIRFLRRH